MPQPVHLDPGALYQQTSQILVAALADAQQVFPAARAVLARHPARRGGKILAATALLAIAHSVGQHAGRDRADAGHRHQSLAQIVLGQLRCTLFLDPSNLLVQVLVVGLQPFQHLYKARRQVMFREHGRQAP